MNRRQLLSFTGIAGLILAAALVLPISQAAPLKPGTKAPAWKLKDLDGKTIDSSEFQGKIVVLNFWATWCGPCVKEIPSFIKLQEKLGKDGLTFVGISLDDSQAPVRKFVASRKVNYPIVMGDSKIADTFGGIEGIPTTFIIDRTGKILKTHVGYLDETTIEKELQAALKASKP